MTDVNVDFLLQDDEPIRADFEVEQDNTLVANISVEGSNDHNVLINRGMDNQHPISAITDLQDTLDTLHGEIGELGQTIGTYGDIVTHNTDEFATAEQGALADTALQPGDNISELVNDSDYATETYVDNGLSEKQDVISDLSTIREGASLGATAIQRVETGNSNGAIRVDGRDVAVKGLESAAYTPSSDYATSAQGALADTALQPNDNISELNNDVGYITSASLPTVNDGTLTIQKNGSSVGTFTANQATNTTVNVVVPTQASDVNALPDTTTIADLTTTAQLNALNSGATTTNIGQITTNENDITSINDKIPSQASSSNQLADKNFVNSSISTNTANFIGTFNSVAELEAYSGTLTNNDYAFVQTTDTAGNTLYDRYKWNGAEWLFEYELNNSSFTAEQWATINSGATSSDVALAQSALQPNDNVSELVNDAGYITSSALPTVNDATLTIQKNGTSVGTFTANASSNVTANITVPTDTGDLTNGAGFITGITSGDVTTALGYTPYSDANPSGYISGITSGDVTTALGYTPYNSTNPSGYITATALNGYATQTWVGQQGYLTSISSGDVTSALGYTPADNSDVSAIQANYVTTNTAQTISARKTFGDRIERSSNIDQTSTTGSVEIQAFNVMDKTNNSVSMLNTVRSSTRNYQAVRAYNKNVTGGNWMDIRVNVQDDGIGYVNIDKGANVENRNLTKSTSSKTDTYIATMGWVNDGSKSTNVVHRDGTETITGNKNFTGDLTAVTQTAGDNSTKVATTAYVENAVSASGGVPTGSILPFGGSSAPTGFLMCDGSAVSRTTYADLYAVIGDTYGSGDGSTTFNLPNLSTAVLPSTSTVDVMGNGNALGITDTLNSQQTAWVVGSHSGSIGTRTNPTASFGLSTPLAIGSTASSSTDMGTGKMAVGISTLPQWSGLTGSITGVTLNYIIRT